MEGLAMALELAPWDDNRRFPDIKLDEIKQRGLMLPPEETAQEKAEVAGMCRLFEVLHRPIVVHHPHIPILVELNQLVGPRRSYLISVGDCEQAELDLLMRHLMPDDTVLDL